LILIIARFETKPDYSERWAELVAPLTAATRAEQGNLWFDWSRNLDKPRRVRPRRGVPRQ
jgi:quinol monooxygenase YgiN